MLDRNWGTTGGVLLGLAVATACIIPDKGIKVKAPGYYWCAIATDAHAYGAGLEPAPIYQNNNWVQECLCLTPDEDADMQAWILSPPSQGQPGYNEYTSLVSAIKAKVEDTCVAVYEADHVANGYTSHDCAGVLAAEDVFRSSAEESDCTYLAGGDTDGYDTDATAHITCVRNTCEVDESFVDEMWADLTVLIADDTRAEEEPTGAGIKIKSVSSGDIADLLGLQTDDVVFEIGGYSVSSIDDAAQAMIDLQGTSSFTIKLTRSGRTLTMSYTVV